MKRTILILIGTVLFAGVTASLAGQTDQTDQSPADSPESFRASVDFGTTLVELNDAVGDIPRLDELSRRTLILNGTVNSITVYSEEPDDYYVELEIVAGRWHGVESVRIYRTYVFFDDPRFTGQIVERAPRDPDPSLVLRNRTVLVAGKLVSLAEGPEGHPVPVLYGYDVRVLR